MKKKVINSNKELFPAVIHVKNGKSNFYSSGHFKIKLVTTKSWKDMSKYPATFFPYIHFNDKLYCVAGIAWVLTIALLVAEVIRAGKQQEEDYDNDTKKPPRVRETLLLCGLRYAKRSLMS